MILQKRNIQPIKDSVLDISLENYNPIEYFMPDLIALEQERANIVKSFNSALVIADMYDDKEVLTEGVSDFFTTVNEFLKKLIAKIKDFVANFFIKFNAYFMDTKRFIDKYGEKLKHMDVDFKMHVNDFNIVLDEPRFDIAEKIVGSYDRELSELKTLTIEEINKKRADDIRNNTVGQELASIVGESKPITLSEAQAIYKKQVVGDSKELHITNSVYVGYIDNHKNLIKRLDDIKDNRDSIVNAITELQAFFSQGPSKIYDDGKASYSARRISFDEDKGYERQEHSEEFDHDSEEKSKQVLEFFNRKYADATHMLNTVNSLLNVKMSAARDELAQSSKIIKAGIKKENQAGGRD